MSVAAIAAAINSSQTTIAAEEHQVPVLWRNPSRARFVRKPVPPYTASILDLLSTPQPSRTASSSSRPGAFAVRPGQAPLHALSVDTTRRSSVDSSETTTTISTLPTTPTASIPRPRTPSPAISASSVYSTASTLAHTVAAAESPAEAPVWAKVVKTLRRLVCLGEPAAQL